jgi:HlyD family secretion protein
MPGRGARAFASGGEVGVKTARRIPARKLAAILMVVALGVGGAAWLRARPLPVAHAVVQRGSVATEVMGTGTLEARVSAVISPRVAGLLTSVLVDQGDRVKRGQLLATLYDGDLAEQVRMGEVDVTVARAAVEQAAAQSAAATATAQEARTSHGRATRLVGDGLVSRDEFDKALRQRDVTDADLTRARVTEVASARQVQKAKATARYARERLTDTRLLAPFDGFVVKRVRDPGNVAVPGDAILQLISLDTMWIAAWVDETAMAAVRLGQPARVVFRSEPTTAYEGTVARIEPQVDPETREFLVDVQVRRLPTNWGIGQRAEVFIETGRRAEVPLVPIGAVTTRGGRTGVFVAESGRARWRPVVLGLRGRETAEVVAGLSHGDVVVWSSASAGAALVEGRRVKGS